MYVLRMFGGYRKSKFSIYSLHIRDVRYVIHKLSIFNFFTEFTFTIFSEHSQNLHVLLGK